MRYSDKFKEKAIKRDLSEEGSKTKTAIAKELRVSKATLYKWVREAGDTATYGNNSFNNLDKLQILKETYSLSGEQLSIYCREKGMFEHQIKTFEEEFLSLKVEVIPSSKKELEVQKLKVKELKKELRRKEKALAETAALLVLQKKFQALFQDEE